jgi:hypothetical protein
MKKIIIFVFGMLMAFSVFAQKNSSSDFVSAIATTYTDSKTAIDTLYHDGKALVSTIYNDTKSLTSTIYPDVKAAVAQIASAIGVAAEYVWGALVKSFVVKGAVEILHLLFALVFIVFGCILFSKNFKSEQITWKIIPGMIVVIIGLIIACNVDYYTMLTGLINPEYGAIDYILKFVKA